MSGRHPWTSRAGASPRGRPVRRTITTAVGVAVGVAVGAMLLLVRAQDDGAGRADSSTAARAEATYELVARRPAPATSPTPSPAPTTAPGRAVSAGDPLRVWIAGDSMWEAAGPALARLLEETGRAATEVDVHYSSGLTRPDFFDWVAHAADTMASERPELVLFLAGANDSQPLVEGGTTHQPGTSGFAEVYLSRTRELMAQLAVDGCHVMWVGLPVMRSPGYDARMTTLTELHRTAAGRVPGVEFVPTRDLFADDGGGFADTLPDADGVQQVMRGADGIHLSGQGADLLAEHLFTHITQRGLLVQDATGQWSNGDARP